MIENDPNYAKIADYINKNPAAVLSTAGKNGPHGAAIYVVPATQGIVCFVTKNQTRKFANITENPAVSLTFFNEKGGTTLQAAGEAYVADDKQGLKELILERMTAKHSEAEGWLPPITEITNGEYVVIGIKLSYIRLTDYSKFEANGPAVTELQ